MPEVLTDTTTTTEPVVTTTESLGWRAGLPDDLKQNTDIAAFKTVGDFAKNHLETAAKVTKLEGALKDAVPKLPDNATDDERCLYYDALGRPHEAKDYKLPGEDKNAPEWNALWKDNFHRMG